MEPLSDSYYVQTTEYDPDITYSDTNYNQNHNLETINLSSFEKDIKYPADTLLKTDVENIGLSEFNNELNKSIILDKNTAKEMYKQVINNNQSGGGSKLSNLVGVMYTGNISQKVFIDGYSKQEQIIMAHDLLGKNYKIKVNNLSIN